MFANDILGCYPNKVDTPLSICIKKCEFPKKIISLGWTNGLVDACVT